MSTTTNVQFYEKIKHLQDSHYESEQRRMDLEQQLNSYIKSDNRLARLKAVRLQNYWKKICEDEKRSQSRNEQVLRDLERVESHMNALSTRTEKLRTMKNQYERYIEQTYPNWKEKILHQQRLQQQYEGQVQMNPASYTPVVGPQIVATVPAAEGYTPSPIAQPAGYISVPQQESYRISTTLPASGSSGPQPYLPPGPQQSLPHTVTGLPATSQPPQTVAYPPRPALDTVDTAPNQPVHVPAPAEVQEAPVENITGVTPRLQPTPAERQTATADIAGLLRDVTDNEAVTETDSSESVGEGAIEPASSPRRPAAWEHETTDQTLPSKPTHNAYLTDDTDDFDTDMSLPMSASDMRNPSTDHQVSAPRVQSPQSVYLQPDLTFQDLYNLMTAIEAELPRIQQTKELYRMTQQPAETVKREIYQNANKPAMLSHINATSISLVILDQLPLLVMGSENNCLLPDDILYRPSPSATQDSVRMKIHGTSHALWDRLCLHLLHLLKYNVMTAAEIGDTFGPLLVSEDSPYENKAQELVTMVMENSDPDVIESPRSTSTFSTLSPRKPNTEQQPVLTPIKSEPSKPQQTALSPDSRPHGQSVAGTPLTQTAAYRQLLGDTVSTSQKTMSYDDSDDDDIENQLGSVVSGKPESPQKSVDPRSPTLSPGVAEVERSLSPAILSRGSSPSFASTGAGLTGSKNAKKGPAFLYGGDTDTDEDIDIPGMGASEVVSPVKHGQEEDDFDFYG